MEQLANCIGASSLPKGRSAFAYGQLWQRALTEAIEPQSTLPMEMPKRAVVVGGTGGIGRNICRALLEGSDTRIDIIARKPDLPDCLTGFSDRITLHSIDLASDDIMWPAFDIPVDDIIFAAGLGSYGPVMSRDAEQMHALNKSKLNGAISLETLIAETRPKRVIYCSSMAAELGGKGQLDYSAANGLLDGIAHWVNPKSPDNTTFDH